MSFVQFLLLVLMSLKPYYTDKETWEERQARMAIVAAAIDDASSKLTCEDKYKNEDCKREFAGSKRQIALMLVTKGWWESRFAKHVHENQCGPDECDAVKKNGVVFHRARSPWQIQRTGLLVPGEWTSMKGPVETSTVVSAGVAGRILSYGFKRCGTVDGSFGAYAGGGCGWSGALNRGAFFRRLSAKTEATFKKDQEARLKEATAKK